MDRDLFAKEPYLKAEIGPPLARLAEQGVHLGTSSWKYPGWCGSVYEEARYHYRGRLAKTRFERDCLEEYAETFSTVCVDAGYYRFPDPRFIDRICGQVPDRFLFSFKVTDEITIARFPRVPRHGDKGGSWNPRFLDAEIFRKAFLRPLAPHADRIGCLIFEFSQMKQADLESIDFLPRLGTFLRSLPTEWQYAVEIRNPDLLGAQYFETLASAGVAHVHSSWERMPSLSEQLALPESRTTDFAAARLLLKPGRRYSEAVESFEPYEKTQEELPEVRTAAAQLVEEIVARQANSETRQSFLYVNNRLEGNGPLTIKAILREAGLLSSK